MTKSKFSEMMAQIRNYSPFNEQEKGDKAIMLSYMESCPDIFLRTNLKAHMTASSWIVNRDRTKILMIYHNIYDSWAWTGGHADGDENLLAVALREALEETGVHAVPVTEDIFSLENLTVDGHFKHGLYVPSHMHLNVTYLLQADDSEAVRAKEDENRGVSWFSLDEVLSKPSAAEAWMVKNIYSKLNVKLGAL